MLHEGFPFHQFVILLYNIIYTYYLIIHFNEIIQHKIDLVNTLYIASLLDQQYTSRRFRL